MRLLLKSGRGRLRWEISDLVIARVKGAALSGPFFAKSLALFACALRTSVGARFTEGLLV